MPELYWRYSYSELRSKVQLRYGQVTSEHLCTYHSLVSVVSAALGGGSKSDPTPRPALVTDDATSLEQAVASVNQMLRF